MLFFGQKFKSYGRLLEFFKNSFNSDSTKLNFLQKSNFKPFLFKYLILNLF